jgi:hypothetical protein
MVSNIRSYEKNVLKNLILMDHSTISKETWLEYPWIALNKMCVSCADRKT